MNEGRFGPARPILEECFRKDPTDWAAAYMAGQCCRFAGDLDSAAELLRAAAALAPAEKEVFLALGIAEQLRGRYQDAGAALGRAVQIDPDYVLAFNSLGLTRKKAGDLVGALDAYESGRRALARQVASSMKNQPENKIVKHRNVVGQVWVELATHAAMFIAAQDPRVSRVVFPTGAQAEEEERTERHAGLYWTVLDGEEPMLYFLPNFFNTFRETLREDPVYADLVGNTGAALEALGRPEEASEHFAEAEEFSPR